VPELAFERGEIVVQKIEDFLPVNDGRCTQ
jgi:hypothetical protein